MTPILYEKHSTFSESSRVVSDPICKTIEEMALAMVGEALISASVDILLNRITSKEFRDFFSSTNLNVSLLDELKIKLLALNAVLNDAEEKQITDLAVKAWFDELKDAVYDAEDLLDQINTESLRCKLEGQSKAFTSKGCGEEDLVNTLLKKQLLPTSLLHLYLEDFTDLKLLEGKGLQDLTFLQTFGIYNCGSLESLPEDHLPSSLQELNIWRSPLLEGRYQSRKGKYWSKIAHVPTIIIHNGKEKKVIVT